MNEKIGRNDPCPCGSGKKYKQCCLLKSAGGVPLKFKAKVLSQPQIKMPEGPDLMDRTFGHSVQQAQNTPPPKPYKESEKKES